MRSITFAIVKVLPDPVTPKSTCDFLPLSSPPTRRSIAAGWSPAGSKSVFSRNIVLYQHLQQTRLFKHCQNNHEQRKENHSDEKRSFYRFFIARKLPCH